MKKIIEISQILKNPDLYTGKDICVAGWIRTLRDQKNFAFLMLNDGSCFDSLQLVLQRDELEAYESYVRLGTGAAIYAEGCLLATPEAKQPVELHVRDIQIEGDCPLDYPLQPKRHSPEFLRSIAYLRPRTNLYSAVFRVRSEAAFAIHEFFHQQGFVYVHTPIITGSDAEGAGEMFTVTTLPLEDPPRTEAGGVDYSEDFFGKHTNLTVSGQLSGECFAQAFRNIYTFGPTFRAENSNTTRHAAEFWMMEPEMAFAELKDVMDLAEKMLKFIISRVLERCPDEMDFFNRFVEKGLLERLQNVLDHDFVRITYTQAIDDLKASGSKFKYPVEWGSDLQTEHERYLTEKLYKKPLFVTDYPAAIKAFYMKLNPDGKTVAATDCLVPGIGEIIGGSQREDDYEKLLQRMEHDGMKKNDYWWYLNLRRFGSTRHGGFGLGFERLVMYLTGVSNIRDVIPFPRTVGNADF